MHHARTEARSTSFFPTNDAYPLYDHTDVVPIQKYSQA